MTELEVLQSIQIGVWLTVGFLFVICGLLGLIAGITAGK